MVLLQISEMGSNAFAICGSIAHSTDEQALVVKRDTCVGVKDNRVGNSSADLFLITLGFVSNTYVVVLYVIICTDASV